METVDRDNPVATEEASQKDGQGSAKDASEATQASAPPAELLAERDRLLREKAELQDLAQRRQAEFDNYRRRSEKERGEIFEFAGMDTIKALLPVLDDFERSLKAETADKEYARGIELIYNRFSESLKKLGLEPIQNESGTFDPHVHHAVEMVDTKDHPDQTILDVYQRGYNYKGRLVRPAMVKVAVNQ